MVSNFKPSIFISTAVVTAVTIGFFVYLVKKKSKNRIPIEWKKVGTVKKLYIFPLKSGRYIEIDNVECTKRGFKMIKSEKNLLELRDRSFSVYSERNKEQKGGRHISTIVKVELSPHNENHIALNASSMETLYVKMPERNKNNVVNITMFTGETIETLDCGDMAAEWLSKCLLQKDSGLRLGYYEGSKVRNILKPQKERMKHYKYMSNEATGLFSDFTSVMIMNQASANECIERIPEENITTMNFRANIIVDDPELKPYDEDDWDWVKIGEVVMRNVKDCTRCAFTTVDPETGTINRKREPLTVMSTYRMRNTPEKAPVMGIHMDVRKTGLIESGDTVYVHYKHE